MAGQLACDSGSHVNRRVLLHAANLRRGTDGFTSPLKEGMLWTFSLEKFDGFGRVRTRDVTLPRIKPLSIDSPPSSLNTVLQIFVTLSAEPSTKCDSYSVFTFRVKSLPLSLYPEKLYTYKHLTNMRDLKDWQGFCWWFQSSRMRYCVNG
jgi:hypothetical protein